MKENLEKQFQVNLLKAIYPFYIQEVIVKFDHSPWYSVPLT